MCQKWFLYNYCMFSDIWWKIQEHFDWLLHSSLNQESSNFKDSFINKETDALAYTAYIWVLHFKPINAFT